MSSQAHIKGMLGAKVQGVAAHHCLLFRASGQTSTRHSRTALRQSALPGPQEAVPAVDALFDAFEFAFSPAGGLTIVALIAIGFIWDFLTASNNRTLLGQAYDKTVTMSRFAIKFSSTKDGIYESPSGGAERIIAGMPYIEDFEDLAGAVALGKSLQRSLGNDNVEFRTYEVRGSEWIERVASSASIQPNQRKGTNLSSPQNLDKEMQPKVWEDGSNQEPPMDDLDKEWKALMDKSTLLKRSDVGLDGVEMTVITAENACPLCNGRGLRGCSRCSNPSNVPDSQGKWPIGMQDGGPACQLCYGKRLLACEWCKGSGLRVK